MVSNTISFWIYISFYIPSVLCTIFIIAYVLLDRNLRRTLNNHIIVLILSIGLIYLLTVYPWMFYFYRYNGVWRRSKLFCVVWVYIDWSLYVTQTMLFAWATVERHILIFHDKWISTRKKRFFVHYVPPVFILLYGLIFYIVFYFFPPCQNYFYNGDIWCLDACMNYNNIYTMWEVIAHEIVPAFIIIICSVALLARVLWQKRRLNQIIDWRKHRKMVIQILSISILYFLCSFPYAISMILLAYRVRGKWVRDLVNYAVFISYFSSLWLPFVCLLTIPELRSKLMKYLRMARRCDRVAALSITVKPKKQGQTQTH